jgi:uncharacterized protein YdiU (UPF0061 family)
LPGAVLTRIAASHIRVGTFQYFAARGDYQAVRLLADYVIDRHFPEARAAASPIRALLDGVIGRQASLIAEWLLVGFIHGVMNTDNMSIAGETIDFGPCAFMDAFDPNKVFSSIDQGGRYAYGNQPGIAQWNLARFAETLLPLLSSDEDAAIAEAEDALGAFPAAFETAYLAGFRRKLGFFTEQEQDSVLAQELLRAMAAGQADFTLTFRRLCDAALDGDGEEAVRGLFDDPAAYDVWALGWRRRLEGEGGDPAERRESMRRANPAIIPRNHRIEAVIQAAVGKGDFAPFEELLAALADPYASLPEFAAYEAPPLPEERVHLTFCGT